MQQCKLKAISQIASQYNCEIHCTNETILRKAHQTRLLFKPSIQRITMKLSMVYYMARVRAVAIVCIVGSTFTQHATASDDYLLAKIDTAVQSEMTSQKIPGVAVAVVKNGRLLLAKGYGEANVEHHVPVKTETIFQSGSTGKQLTAVAVMLQVEDGKLALDDPITTFFPDAPAAWKAITVRHLLTHTSGIPDYEDGKLDFHKDYSDETLVQAAYGLTLEFPPGTRWNYSNNGYVLLGIIVQKVSGAFYGDVLAERVFKPLGMTTARVISDANIVPNRADGYQLVNGELKHQDWVAPTLNRTADGSLHMTLLDYVAWEHGLREGKILSAQSWRSVFTPVTLASGKTYPYGFGWRIDNTARHPRVHHGGAWQGFKAYISRWTRDNITVVALANLAQAEPDRFIDTIAGLVDPTLVKAALTPRSDPEPAIAKRLVMLLSAARDNQLQPSEFAFVRAGFFPATANQYAQLLKGLGTPTRVSFLDREEQGDDVHYTYDVVFGERTFRATLSIAPDHKVSGLWIAPRSN